MEKFRNTPPVGEARLAPRRENEAVDTIAEAKASPETLAEIDVAETELKAQLALLSSQRERLESLDVSVLQNSGSPEFGERVEKSFTEIQDAYDSSIRKIQGFLMLSTTIGLGTILATNIIDQYHKSEMEILSGLDNKISETAFQITAGTTIGIYAAAAVGGVAWLIKKWQKSREENALYNK